MFNRPRRLFIQIAAVLVLVTAVVFLQDGIRSQAHANAMISGIMTGFNRAFQTDGMQTVISRIDEMTKEEEEVPETVEPEEQEVTEEDLAEANAVILADIWDGGNYYNADGTLLTPDMNAIMGKSIITAEKLVDYFFAQGSVYPSYYSQTESSGAATIEQFCTIMIDEAAAEGVRPEVVFMQTMKETGWLTFTGDVSIKQYNFAGIGATGGGVPGENFADVRTGIRAQVQHLKAYASEEPLNNECVDPRFDYVTRASSPYIEWLGIQENPNGGGWAADPGYGGAIVGMIRELN